MSLPQSSISNDKSLEVSIGDLIAFVRKYFLFVVAATIVFAILGLLYSFTLPKLFTAQTVLLPEYNMAGTRSFFSMAVGGERTGAEKLTPELYPDILRGTPFGQYMLKQPVVDEAGKQHATLSEYLDQQKTTSLVSSIMGIFSSSEKPVANARPIKMPSKDILYLSREQQGRISRAISLVSITVDDKSGIITMESEMKDPVVAAIAVDAAKKYLVDYVEEYRTSKTTEQLVFLQKRVAEAKARQQSAEYALQSYRDRNRGSFLNVARIEEQRLQSDFTLAQSIYADLVVKMEQAKIKVKEEKPVFKVLEPSKVPMRKSSPKRLVIAFMSALIGGFLSLVYIVFFREKYHLKLI